LLKGRTGSSHFQTASSGSRSGCGSSPTQPGIVPFLSRFQFFEISFHRQIVTKKALLWLILPTMPKPQMYYCHKMPKFARQALGEMKILLFSRCPNWSALVGCNEMDILAIVILLIGIWLIVDAVIGIWRTRNLFFAWQFIGISFIRMPLEDFAPRNLDSSVVEPVAGLLGTFGLIIGLTAAIISLLTDANAITGYIKAKQGRGLLPGCFCLYQPAKKEKKKTAT
jgi:hypothetical protein